MQRYKKHLPKIILAAAAIIFVGMEILALGAAAIFNLAMSEQKMLVGTVTVEKISANIFGKVSFENLRWLGDDGKTLIEVPQGSFKVKILDVITRNFKSTTIEKLMLTGANISLRFDENMNVDFVHRSQGFKNVREDMKKNSGEWEKKISHANMTEAELIALGEERRKIQQERIETGWRNFNVDGRRINLYLELDNCRVEVFFRDRHYLFSRAYFETKIDTRDKMTFEAITGIFGGTMIGRGMKINGAIDFKPEVPECDLSVLLSEVDPSSLGFGLNIHEAMTLSAHFAGKISAPIGDGVVKMDDLKIPGLEFKNVEGNIFYENSTLTFLDVSAQVFGGSLQAHGDYNFDTRYYTIYGRGEKLKTYYALPGSHLHCDVDLNITIQSHGNAKKTHTHGDFVSHGGRYSILKLDSISGKFHTGYRDLNFYDVEVGVWNHKISTDALSIKDGKLQFDPIELKNVNGDVLFQLDL